ncbi:peptidase family C78-domain-containing protein [Cytidiella melzeri]|nr:peptidase family C78-domain-containing protein [Cytidiella melzeri]
MTMSKCPSCFRDLSSLTPEQRNTHCNNHFTEPQAGPSHHSSPEEKGGRRMKQMFAPRSFSGRTSTPKVGQDVFWRSSYSTAPPQNYTPGLIPLLKKALVKSHGKGVTQKAYLCSPGAVHITSESFDRGWGCGYRNYVMACTALMAQEQQPRYPALLESPSPPGIRNLQKIIEQAWKDGFDEEGAKQLNNKLINTTKWIGTAELYVALAYRRIPARLADFELHKQGPDLLINWITDYFSPDLSRSDNINEALLGASPVVITEKMPILLQHAGHSRTVIGYERRRDGSINLFMFDPARRIATPIRELALSEHPSTPSSQKSRAESPSKIRLSPSKLVNKVLHPQQSRRKRRASDTSIENAGSASAKRLRAGNEVIVIDSDDEQNESVGIQRDVQAASGPAHEVDWHKIAEIFRVKAKTLGKKDKYQVLYFPMTEPLTHVDKLARKVVTSQRFT